MYSFWLGIAYDLRWLSSILSFLPSQLTPSPEYPVLQVHVKERLVLVQYASSWQLCSPALHSSTNQQVKVSYKNCFLFLPVKLVFILLAVQQLIWLFILQLCLTSINWDHDLLVQIIMNIEWFQLTCFHQQSYWENVGLDTPIKKRCILSVVSCC